MANRRSPIMDELVRLVIKREVLKKEVDILQYEYTRKFGKLICDIYEKKMNCIFLKKKIGQCVSKKNRGEPIVKEEIEIYFDSEMERYQKELTDMVKYYEACQDVKVSSEADVLKAQMGFRKVAKLIHPDVLGELANDEEIKELWDRAKKAYHANNANEMATIEILVHELLKNKGIDVDEIEVQNPEIKVELVNKDISQIMSSEVLAYKEILDSETLCKEKEASLNDELENYTAYENELVETLNNYFSGGDDIVWKRILIN